MTRPLMCANEITTQIKMEDMNEILSKCQKIIDFPETDLFSENEVKSHMKVSYINILMIFPLWDGKEIKAQKEFSFSLVLKKV